MGLPFLQFLMLLAFNHGRTKGTKHQTFYVSDEAGHDVVGCGQSVESACKSFNPVFLNFDTYRNITIYIDGGNKKRSTYLYPTTIYVLGGSISLKSYGNFKPVFKNQQDFPIPIFQFDSAPTMFIQDIDFDGLTPLIFADDYGQENKGLLYIYNCQWKFLYQRKQLNFIDAAYSLRSDTVFEFTMQQVQLQGCQIPIPIVPFNVTGTWIVNIEESAFENTGFIIKVKEAGSLTVNNSTFDGFVGSDFYIDINGFSDIIMSNIITLSRVREPAVGKLGMLRIQNVKRVNIECSEFKRISGIILKDINKFTFINNNVSDLFYGIFLETNSVQNVNICNSTFANIQTFITIVLNQSLNVQIDHSTFTNSSSPIQIHLANAVELFHCIFKQCSTGFNGGAISIITNRGNMKISHSTFDGNQAGSKGGAIHSENTNIEISNSVFDQNYAASSGTFSFIGSNNVVTFKNVNVTSMLLSKQLPVFSTIMDNNGPLLEIQQSHIYITSSKGDVDLLTTSLKKSSTLFFSCPENSRAKFLQTASLTKLSCQHCDRGKYSLQAGSARYLKGMFISSSTFYCHPCPYGGNCQADKDITGRINFWGFKSKFEITFVQCPVDYCCSKSENCIGINSCSNNREGSICGVCKAEHHINFFDDQCIRQDHCKHVALFWVIYAFAGVLFAIVIGYLTDMGQLFKKFCCKTHELREPIIAKVSTSVIISGFLKILINFYQMKVLIYVPHVPSTASYFDVLGQILPSIFSLKITIKHFSTEFCPSRNLNVIDKLFIQNVLPALSLLVVAVILNLIYNLCKRNFSICKRYDSLTQNETQQDEMRFEAGEINETNRSVDKPENWEGGKQTSPVVHPDHHNNSEDVENIHAYNKMEEEGELKGDLTNRMPLDVRCKVFVVRLMLILYTNIITYIMLMTNFVEIPAGKVLLVSGETPFYNYKTYLCLVFLFLFAFAFPVNTYLVTRWLQERKISINWFVLCFTFPPFTIMFRIWGKNDLTSKSTTYDSKKNDYETESILAIFEEPFREGATTQKPLIWDHVILFRRFVVAVCSIYINNYVIRLAVIIPIIFVMCLHHAKESPYKAKIINNTETICFLILSIIATGNLFWAFFYIYGLDYYQPPISILGDTLKYVEFVLTVAPFIITIIYLVWKLILKSCRRKIQSKCL